MTGKDMETLASVLSGHAGDKVFDEDTVHSIALSLAVKHMEKSPRFNYDAFMQSCGLTDYLHLNR